MGKIKINMDNINDLYEDINKKIDSYFEWKIRPSSLMRYLRKGSIGMKKFIERNNLSDIDRIEKVILDVIEDRYGMESDGVLKFEKYNNNYSKVYDHDFILYNELPEVNSLEYEKIIADYFRTSLGHIETINIGKREFSISTIKEIHDVKAFSTEDISRMINNLSLFIKNKISKSKIEFNSIDLEISLSKLVPQNIEIKDILELSNEIVNTITEILIIEEYSDYKYFKGYHLWIK